MAENENKPRDDERRTGGFYTIGETLVVFSLVITLICAIIAWLRS